MSEKLKNTAEQGQERKEALKSLNQEKHEEIERQLGKKAEEAKGEDAESARHEALELAEKTEKEKKKKDDKAEKIETKRTSKPTKEELDRSFKKTMKHIQKDMSPASRTFSKIIHNPVVEKTSEVLGKTVARPNLILAGALGTIVICSVVYLIAKKYGYVLSGSEAMITFVLGWIVGAIIEFARVGITNRS